MLDLAGLQPLQEQRRPTPDVTRRVEYRLIDVDGATRPLRVDGKGDGFDASVSWHAMLPLEGMVRAYQGELSVVCQKVAAGKGSRTATAQVGSMSRSSSDTVGMSCTALRWWVGCKLTEARRA